MNSLNSERATHRVPLANRCARVIDAARDTNILELVTQGSYKRLEVAMRAQWDNKDFGRGNCWRERENTTGFILLAGPVDVLAKSLM